jgi:hypothetical protein
MTIERGRPWGEPIERPADLAVVSTDAELASCEPVDGPVGLAGGDLFRSVGSPQPRLDSMCLPIDRLHVAFDNDSAIAVAHVVARRQCRWCFGWWSWWRGHVLAICNADSIGPWNVAPRAHPNDGRFDVVEVIEMRRRERWAARQRLAQGTHVPHPAITVRTATEATWEFSRPMRIWIDGVDRGACTRLAVTIEPDALSIIV